MMIIIAKTRNKKVGVANGRKTRVSKPRLASVLVLIIWKYCIVDSLASQEKIGISSHSFVSWFAVLALTVTGGRSLNPNIKI